MSQTINPSGCELPPVRIQRKRFASLRHHDGIDRLVLTQGGQSVSLPAADIDKLIVGLLKTSHEVTA